MAINGTANSETLVGTNVGNDIYGFGGDDTIIGRGGDDNLFGGAGNDQLFGNEGNDNIHGGTGNDTLSGGTGVNNMWGGGGADTFMMSFNTSAASDDWIGDFNCTTDKIDLSAWGISDFSQLQAVMQTDATGDAWMNAAYNGYNHFLTICGFTAADLDASDFIFSNAGASIVTGTDYGDVLFGSSDKDTIRAGRGDDTLLGGMSNDRLLGGAGADTLMGGEGNDVLNGNGGRDMLTGGAGADVFVFTNIQSGDKADVITDFASGVDRIKLLALDADTTADGNQHFTFIGSADFTDVGQLHVTHEGGNTIISGNTGGDLSPDFQIVLQGSVDPVAADFIL